MEGRKEEGEREREIGRSGDKEKKEEKITVINQNFEME